MAQRRITIRFQKHNRCCPDNVWMTLLYVLKGTPYHIKGRIHTSSFDKNGKKHYLTDAVAKKIETVNQDD